MVILPHLLLQRGSSIGSLQGRKVQNLADVKPASHQLELSGKKQTNSQLAMSIKRSWRGELLSLFGPTFRLPTNAENNFHDHFQIMFQSKTHGVFPTSQDAKSAIGRLQNSGLWPSRIRRIRCLLWLLQKPPWLWLAPVARQRGWWKDIEHGTKQLKQHHFQYFRTHVLYHIYIIYIIYNYIYTYMYITY